MDFCVGGIILPSDAALLTHGHESQFLDQLLAERPKAIVATASQAGGIEDMISMYVQPRLKGCLPDSVLGFETEAMLVKGIAKQSKRFGLPLELLTDDVLARHGIKHELGSNIIVPLAFLHKQGYKDQLVYVTYGNISFEEMYTFGKAVQMAIKISKKKTAILAAANIATQDSKWQNEFIESLQNRDVKTMLDMAYNLPVDVAVDQLRSVFLLLGALSTIEFANKEIKLWQYNNHIFVSGGFARVI